MLFLLKGANEGGRCESRERVVLRINLATRSASNIERERERIPRAKNSRSRVRVRLSVR